MIFAAVSQAEKSDYQLDDRGPIPDGEKGFFL
jgi:hypothetical protein